LSIEKLARIITR